MKVVKGIVRVAHKLRDTKTYPVTNRSTHDRTLIVEHPIRTAWKFVAPAEATEQSRDVYRFAVKVPAGKSLPHEVTEEQSPVDPVAISSNDDHAVRLFLSSQVTIRRGEGGDAEGVVRSPEQAERLPERNSSSRKNSSRRSTTTRRVCEPTSTACRRRPRPTSVTSTSSIAGDTDRKDPDADQEAPGKREGPAASTSRTSAGLTVE